MQQPLLSTNYLGPIQYFSHLFHSRGCIVEQYCHYQKQTYRNRCIIDGANGTQLLIIPILKQFNKTYTRDIRISYDTPWQSLHWKCILSAYNSSPYFEYYMDDFAPFYHQKFDFLIDYNDLLTSLIGELLDIKLVINKTDAYAQVPEDKIDLREVISPKNIEESIDKNYISHRYRQVFEIKHGFRKNLSIIDLLFNKGPETILVLKNSYIDL